MLQVVLPIEVPPLPVDILLKLLLTVALGALIGMEREVRKAKAPGAGIRTYSLIALLGFFAASFEAALAVPAVLVTLAALAALTALSYFIFATRRRMFGVTTEVSFFLAFFIGVLVALDSYWPALLLSVLTTALLVSKAFVRHYITLISERDIVATIKFLIIAAIIFPVLPNYAVDPWGVLNPFIIWGIVVTVAAVSFLGWIAVRLLGQGKGLKIAGGLGGLVNSDATMAALASRYREVKADLRDFAAASILSNTTMLIRNLVIAVIAGGMLMARSLWFPIAIMFVVGLFTVGEELLLKRTKAHPTAFVKLATPFALKPALEFAAIFAVTAAAVAVARIWFGDVGVFTVAILAALISSGAAIASTSALAAGGMLPTETAVTIAIIACILSSLRKPAWAWAMGARDFGRELLPSMVLVSVAGVLLIALRPWIPFF